MAQSPLFDFYQQRTNASEVMPRKITPLDDNSGSQNITNALSNVSNVLDQKQKADETTYAANEITGFQAQMQKQFLDSQNSARPGAAGFTPDFLKQFDETAKGLTDGYAGYKYAGPMLEQGIRNARLHFQEQAVSYEAQAGRQFRGVSIDNNRDTLGTVVRADPGQLNQSLAQHLAQINESNLPPEERLRYMRAADKELPYQAAMGSVEKNPYDARDRLAKPIDTNAALESRDSVFSQLIDPATREHVRNYAEAKIAKLEAEGRAKDIENSHKVENQFTDMIDTYTRGQPWGGPPLTKDQLIAVYGDENGTKNFDRLNNAQRFGTNLTNMSTMPTTQIIDMSKAVEPGAGSQGSADRNRLADMTQRAAEQILKERRIDPRQADLDHNISGATPLNFNDMTGAIREINTRIGNSEKTNQVMGFKTLPLSISESKVLATMLTASDAPEQVKMLKTIRDNITDDAGYESVMKQIAPHSPVTAIVGMMLGNNSPTQTASWFNPKLIPDDKGMQNILAGEALLNPQAAQKGQTEKTGFKSVVEMPPDSQLRGEFMRRAGHLFAGQPLLSDDYFSAYKAAYAGRLAEKGKQTGQVSQDNISQDAMADVFGSRIVTYNKKEMLVPPGMDPGRFGGLVRNAIEASSVAALPASKLDLSKYRLAPGDAVDQSKWEKRADGSTKGSGYLGVLKRPDGAVSSEISVSTDLKDEKGKEIEFPTMVPTLSQKQLDWLMTNDPAKNKIPRDIVSTAEAYARQRLSEGQSVWATDADRLAAKTTPKQWLENMGGYTLQDIGPAGVGSGKYAVMIGHNQQLLYPGSRRPVIIDLNKQYATAPK